MRFLRIFSRCKSTYLPYDICLWKVKCSDYKHLFVNGLLQMFPLSYINILSLRRYGINLLNSINILVESGNCNLLTYLHIFLFTYHMSHIILSRWTLSLSLSISPLSLSQVSFFLSLCLAQWVCTYVRSFNRTLL